MSLANSMIGGARLGLRAFVAGWLLTSLAVARPVEELRIGVVFDGEWSRHAELSELFQREIVTLLAGEFEVRFPEDRRIVADWSADGIRQAVDELLAAEDLDVVMTLGFVSSVEVASRSALPKTTLAPLLFAADLVGVPAAGGSGIPNLSYVTSPSHLGRDLMVFADLSEAKRIGILANRSILDGIPSLRSAALAEALSVGLDVSVIPVDVRSSAADVLRSIPDDVEGVFVTPLFCLTREEFDELLEGLTARRLPTFSLFGRSDVEAGVLATLSPDNDWNRLARRNALNLQRILLGEDASTIPVDIATGERLTINMATARATGTWPRFDLLVDAEIIAPDPAPEGSLLTLRGAVEEALALNLNLRGIERFVAAGIGDVDEARSQLLPQVDALLNGSVIDKDRARASFGNTSRRTYTAGVQLRQLVYAEPVWADIDIEDLRQEQREWVLAEFVLDIIQATSIAYLDLLRVMTRERILRENLELTRSNLELARTRVEVGVANRSEVDRWEAQMAFAKRDVIRTESQHRIAEISLNRLLHRGLERPLGLMEVGLDDPSLVTSDSRLSRAIDNPWAFAIFRDFAVQEALRNAPELVQIDRDVAIAERLLQSRRAAFWQPEAAIEANLARRFHEGGTVGQPLVGVPQADDEDWSVGFSVSYPLVTGGARGARLRKAREEVAQLTLERGALAERVEQRVRNAMHVAAASYTSIRLTREASEAAGRNLELVRDSYSSGVLSILDLLDAQRAALDADIESEAATYEFLIDLMDIERAMGEFALSLSAAERDAWFDRLASLLDETEDQP